MGDGLPVDKIKNLSVRKTIILYMSVSLVCSFFLSVAIVGIASHIQKQIWWKYVDEEKYFELVEKNFESVEKEGVYFTTDISRPAASDMGRMDYEISELCDFLQTWTILLLSVIGSLGAVFLFYRHKLKLPIEELERASRRIAENDLDFQVTYEAQDEMGHLCQEFEKMRSQLAQNNRKLWRNIEDERALRAAIAHDIRSPLSVLKGYQEMLIEFLPDGTIDMEKAMVMLSESKKQIERMDVFVETMRKMNSLEQRELLPVQITAGQLQAEIQAELEILGTEKKVVLDVPKTKEIFSGDKEVILEVTENLLSNALRYAKERVEVKVEVTVLELTVRVRDDGNGFLDDAEKITKAFYQQNIKDSFSHAGMGMYISRLYCEKHGGILLLENEEAGGAAVTAIFRRIA